MKSYHSVNFRDFLWQELAWDMVDTKSALFGLGVYIAQTILLKRNIIMSTIS